MRIDSTAFRAEVSEVPRREWLVSDLYIAKEGKLGRANP